MTSRSIRSFVLVAMALAAACKQGASADPSTKAAGGEPAPAAAPTAPTTPTAPVTAPPATGALTLGPIDVAAGPVDLAALFPGTTSVLHLGNPQARDDDEFGVDTIEVRRGDKPVVLVALDGTRIRGIQLVDPSLPIAGGPQVGASVDELARAYPDATCLKNKYELSCDSKAAPGLVWSLNDDADTDGEWGEDEPIAKVVRPATVASISWNAPDGSTLAVAARPKAVVGGEPADDEGADDDDDANRKPTADEVARCARLLAVTAACGVVYDPEYSWIGGAKKKWTAAAAHKACDVESLFTDGGPSMPVHLIGVDAVARVEAAAKQGCGALKQALDQVDPGMGPAGYSPSGE